MTPGVSNASRDHNNEDHLYVRYSSRHPGVPSRMADPSERSMPRNGPTRSSSLSADKWASFTPQSHASRGRLNRVVGRAKLKDGAGCMLSRISGVGRVVLLRR